MEKRPTVRDRARVSAKRDFHRTGDRTRFLNNCLRGMGSIGSFGADYESGLPSVVTGRSGALEKIALFSSELTKITHYSS